MLVGRDKTGFKEYPLSHVQTKKISICLGFMFLFNKLDCVKYKNMSACPGLKLFVNLILIEPVISKIQSRLVLMTYNRF